MIELLVVIGIISILIAVSVIVGAKVVGSGKGRVTADSIRVLDAALGDYINRVGHAPPATTRVDLPGNPSNNVFPLADAVDTDTGKTINTVGLFIQMAEGTSGVGSAISQINDKFVRRVDVDGGGPQPELTTILDAWSQPIRLVHPTFDGIWTQGNRPEGQPGNPVNLTDPSASPIKDQNLRNDLAIVNIRRNFLTDDDRANWNGPGDPIGDSDGGLCPTPRPYFYSAGEDGDPSTLDDNVYTNKPRNVVE